MRSAPLALLLALAAAVPAAAQDPSDNPAEDFHDGVLAEGPTVSARQAMEVCLEFPAAWVRRHPRAAELRPVCEVDDTGELERTADRTWSWTRYRWTTVIPPHDPRTASPDTIVEEEVVLFSAPLDRDERTAEWHVRYWTQYTSRVTVQVAATADDGALLSGGAVRERYGGLRAVVSAARRVRVAPRPRRVDGAASGRPGRVPQGRVDQPVHAAG
jgi:hypothetical protein